VGKKIVDRKWESVVTETFHGNVDSGLFSVVLGTSEYPKQVEGGAMFIGDVAQKLNVSQSTILRWEREGNIPKATRTPVGYRAYTDEDVDAIRDFLKEKHKDKIGYARIEYDSNG